MMNEYGKRKERRQRRIGQQKQKNQTDSKDETSR